jgi:predicted nucleic acid-binding protein
MSAVMFASHSRHVTVTEGAISMTEWGKTHYLDASVLVKLIADDPEDEPGRKAVREYYWQHTDSVYATSFSIAETFSAFKGKFRREQITESQYVKYVREFIRLTVGANLRIDEVSIFSSVVVRDAERLIKTYQIDFLDCFQIVTIMHGKFSVLGPNSQSLLITADDGLAKAARAEGAKVWNCRNEPAPA